MAGAKGEGLGGKGRGDWGESEGYIGGEQGRTKETNVAHALYGSKCTGIQCPVFERRENERRRL